MKSDIEEYAALAQQTDKWTLLTYPKGLGSIKTYIYSDNEIRVLISKISRTNGRKATTIYRLSPIDPTGNSTTIKGNVAKKIYELVEAGKLNN